MRTAQEGSSFASDLPPAQDILSLSSPEGLRNMFESFIDSIDVGVFVLDCCGTVNRVNRRLLEHYRWNKEELVGQNLFALVPDLTALGVEERFHQIVAQRRSMELTNIQRKDRFGREAVFNLTGMPILENGDIIGVLAVMNDITEKRALESQVAETEEYLKSLIDNANDVIYTLDRDGYITFLNKMGQQVTGYQFNPNEKGHYSLYVPRRTLAKHDKYFREAINGKPQRYESAIVSFDSRIVNVLINTTPIRRGDKVVGILGIARDITERKQMEAQLLQAGKMAAIGELASGVAHEINNPVGIISGAAEQLLFLMEHYREHPEEMLEKLAKHAATIREQAARCKRITQGLLNFARKTEVKKSMVSLPKVLEETIALVGNRALSEKKSITLDVAHDIPILDADSNQLEQVFLNLINNALDAIDKDGLVVVRAAKEDDSVVVDVIDNGLGISEENLKKIFNPFFTTKAPGKGTGLGLSICFGIIQNMNGTITASSKPGTGTTFSIHLPLGR